MTLLEHVYAIKNLLSHGPVSDDFSYSDRLIAHFLQVTRAKLIERKADKYHFISDQSYQSLCVDLALSSFHNCCTKAELECKVLKSIEPIPKFLNSRWGNFLKVMDLAGTIIPEYNLTQNKYSKYSLVGAPKAGWFIHDNHLYIVNNKVLETVLLNALFDKPDEIAQSNCATTGENCTDFMGEQFPIDSDLIDDMYRLTLDFLVKSQQTTIDIENNAKDVETRQGIQ